MPGIITRGAISAKGFGLTSSLTTGSVNLGVDETYFFSVMQDYNHYSYPDYQLALNRTSKNLYLASGTVVYNNTGNPNYHGLVYGLTKRGGYLNTFAPYNYGTVGNWYVVGVCVSPISGNINTLVQAFVGSGYSNIQQYNSEGTFIRNFYVFDTSTTDTTPSYGSAIAADANDNIYVGFSKGDYENVNTSQFGIAKFNSTGAIQWWKKLDIGVQYASVTSIVISDTNIYVTGSVNQYHRGISSLTVPNAGTYICKLDLNGNLIWARNIPGAFASSITYDIDGNVYAIMSISYDPFSPFIIKYDSSGTPIWFHTLTPPGTAISGTQTSIATDSYSNIYVAQQIGTTNYGKFQYSIHKLNNSGVIKWTRYISLGSPTTSTMNVYYDNGYNKLIIDGTNMYFAFSAYENNYTGFKASIVAKLPTDGSLTSGSGYYKVATVGSAGSTSTNTYIKYWSGTQTTVPQPWANFNSQVYIPATSTINHSTFNATGSYTNPPGFSYPGLPSFPYSKSKKTIVSNVPYFVTDIKKGKYLDRVRTDKFGNYYACGLDSSQDQIGGYTKDSIWLYKYNRAGEILWRCSIRGSGTGNFFMDSFDFDLNLNGDIYFAGSFLKIDGYNSYYSHFIGKIRGEDGVLLKQGQFLGPGSSSTPGNIYSSISDDGYIYGVRFNKINGYFYIIFNPTYPFATGNKPKLICMDMETDYSDGNVSMHFIFVKDIEITTQPDYNDEPTNASLIQLHAFEIHPTTGEIYIAGTAGTPNASPLGPAPDGPSTLIYLAAISKSGVHQWSTFNYTESGYGGDNTQVGNFINLAVSKHCLYVCVGLVFNNGAGPSKFKIWQYTPWSMQGYSGSAGEPTVSSPFVNWFKYFDSTTPSTLSFQIGYGYASIAVDDNDDLYLLGNTVDNNNTADKKGFLLKIASDYSIYYAKRIYTPSDGTVYNGSALRTTLLQNICFNPSESVMFLGGVTADKNGEYIGHPVFAALPIDGSEPVPVNNSTFTIDSASQRELVYNDITSSVTLSAVPFTNPSVTAVGGTTTLTTSTYWNSVQYSLTYPVLSTEMLNGNQGGVVYLGKLSRSTTFS